MAYLYYLVCLSANVVEIASFFLSTDWSFESERACARRPYGYILTEFGWIQYVRNKDEINDDNDGNNNSKDRRAFQWTLNNYFDIINDNTALEQ